MAASVEEVSSSLVREYLSRKGLKRTMTCMDEEHPRTEASINNRSQLRQILNIEDLYRRNKVQDSPLKTLLEMIVKHHMERLKKDRIRENDSLQSSQTINSTTDRPEGAKSETNDIKTEEITPAFIISKQTKLWSEKKETHLLHPASTSPLPEKNRQSNYKPADFLVYDLEDQKGQILMTSLQDDESFIPREPEETPSMTETDQKSRTNRIRRDMMAGPIPQESNRKRQSRRAEASQPLLRKEKEENTQSKDGLLPTGLERICSADGVGGKLELANAPESENCFKRMGQNIYKTRRVETWPNMADLDVAEMVLDDSDNDDDLRELSKVSVQRAPVGNDFAGQPMDEHTAAELKAVLLGSSLNYFSAEWRNQGFTFSEIHDLRYGIVQKKGGPCGVLASIQAFVLKNLLFENLKSSNTCLQRLRPSNTTRRECLVLALGEVLWRAGEEKQATVAVNSGRNHFTPAGRCKSEGVLEKIACFTVENIKDLHLLLEQHIQQFETGMLGCLLLTISAVLSRSVEKVREDMDVPSTSLIGAHGYCTQELVNLLLCGRAVSNVFDDDMELDSGDGNVTLLKGIKGSQDIGLLSLFEHYNICKVGAHLKTPRFPVWLVCSESHFSVLFGLQRELLTNEDGALGFDLYYYDGLANQQEEIRLSVSYGEARPSCEDDLIPPLELCIRTRWKDASVSWNDTEPIL
ncbi:probable ubiquitin carboxyl-terminal hydrolase MINDY-4 isoform X1 [Amphiprion ocellaris]|uniref:Ubiquitin carboxyl-terminal hydrolase MINDY n=2 Tax=Amphiprion ocellaris TaxID=80972 RepID=A0A3Q1BXV3_AMPOC|nr:probable ubiquitin carboxyl-terminal hydrolase MINDY-4 isoform X1 [Amphiprion ocellaris]